MLACLLGRGGRKLLPGFQGIALVSDVQDAVVASGVNRDCAFIFWLPRRK